MSRQTSLDAFTIEDERGRRLEACQSPVWDTALAVLALRDAGFDPGHEAVARGALWLAGREVRVPGDWSVRRPDLEPGEGAVAGVEGRRDGRVVRAGAPEGVHHRAVRTQQLDGRAPGPRDACADLEDLVQQRPNRQLPAQRQHVVQAQA